MKLYKSLLALLTLASASVAMTGCNEDEMVTPVYIPVSDWEANTTIADLKTKYWQSDDNYNVEVGLTDAGEHVIIGGYVVGNDLTGNIYQTLMLQDATGALNISVAMKDMNARYKIGEQVFIDCTGLYVGKYAGLFCLGKAEIYEKTNTPQVGRMDEEVWLEHSQPNGLPQLDKIEAKVITLSEIRALKSTDDLIKWQSQFVRINEVSFIGGGELTWGETGSSAVSRYLCDADGNRVTVRNSCYSSFADQVMPAGHGYVEAILSYYNGTWQLAFVTNEDCFDFGGESYAPEPLVSAGDGSADNPFNVGAVVNGDASGTSVWVTGYIVGWINGMSMADGANFTVPATSTSNILLGATPDAKDVSSCIPVQLPSGDLRNALNLQNNPTNLGKQVSILGNIESYFGSKGVKSPTTYAWGDKGGEGTTPDPTPEPETGNALFKKVTAVTSGKQYIFVVDGQMGTPIASTASYGRLTMSAVSIANEEFTADVVNAITIEAVDGGYTLTDSYGRKLAMDESHLTSFQLNYTAGEVWTIAPDGGLFRIANVLNPGCYIVRSGTYTNIAPSDIASYPTYDLPALYEKQ